MSPCLGALVLLVLVGCGRYFPGPIEPAPENRQEVYASVEDDGTIIAVFNRLEVSLRPMTDEELNRQFADYSAAGCQFQESIYLWQLEAAGRYLYAAKVHCLFSPGEKL